MIQRNLSANCSRRYTYIPRFVICTIMVLYRHYVMIIQSETRCTDKPPMIQSYYISLYHTQSIQRMLISLTFDNVMLLCLHHHVRPQCWC